MMENTTYSFRLHNNSSLIILGPSGIGKSFIIFKILRHLDQVYESSFKKIIYVYYCLNDELLKLAAEDSRIVLCDNVLDADKKIERSSLVILDDQMPELQDKHLNKLITNYFTRGCHHKGFSLIMTLQRGFTPETRTIVENATYLIFFDSPRYRSAITHIAKSFSPKNIGWVQEAFKHATEREKRGYLFFDFSPTVDNNMRLRSKVYPFDDEETFVYTP